MDIAPSKPDMLPLLEAVKPHLGQKGQGLVEIALEMMSLFNSQSGEDILKGLYKIAPVFNKEANSIQLRTQTGNVEFTSGSFLVLLVLALLVTGQFGR